MLVRSCVYIQVIAFRSFLNLMKMMTCLVKIQIISPKRTKAIFLTKLRCSLSLSCTCTQATSSLITSSCRLVTCAQMRSLTLNWTTRSRIMQEMTVKPILTSDPRLNYMAKTKLKHL